MYEVRAFGSVVVRLRHTLPRRRTGGRHHPVNPASPAGLRGRSYQPPRCRPVEPDAWRQARPARRRLCSLIPRMRSNPAVLSDGCLTFRYGATETDPGEPEVRLDGAAAVEVGEAPQPNPAQGVRAAVRHSADYSGERLVRLVQPRPAWGASKPATAGTGPLTGFGDPLKRRTAKSSTTRGPRGLAGNANQRRCQIAKSSC